MLLMAAQWLEQETLWTCGGSLLDHNCPAMGTDSLHYEANLTHLIGDAPRLARGSASAP